MWSAGCLWRSCSGRAALLGRDGGGAAAQDLQDVRIGRRGGVAARRGATPSGAEPPVRARGEGPVRGPAPGRDRTSWTSCSRSTRARASAAEAPRTRSRLRRTARAALLKHLPSSHELETRSREHRQRRVGGPRRAEAQHQPLRAGEGRTARGRARYRASESRAPRESLRGAPETRTAPPWGASSTRRGAYGGAAGTKPKPREIVLVLAGPRRGGARAQSADGDIRGGARDGVDGRARRGGSSAAGYRRRTSWGADRRRGRNRWEARFAQSEVGARRSGRRDVQLGRLHVERRRGGGGARGGAGATRVGAAEREENYHTKIFL